MKTAGALERAPQVRHVHLKKDDDVVVKEKDWLQLTCVYVSKIENDKETQESSHTLSHESPDGGSSNIAYVGKKSGGKSEPRKELHKKTLFEERSVVLQHPNRVDCFRTTFSWILRAPKCIFLHFHLGYE